MPCLELKTVIINIESYDDMMTIYCRDGADCTPESDAVVVYEHDDELLPLEADGLEYFLEVSLAKEAIAVWIDWRGGRKPSEHDMLAAVIYYATHDAYLPNE